MSQWTTAQNRPLIPNANDYLYEKKYVSIQSDDRNVIKYHNSSEFTIQLPQDYLFDILNILDKWHKKILD